MNAMRWTLIRHTISYQRSEQEKKENSVGSSYKSPLHKEKISKKNPTNCISSTYLLFQVPKITALSKIKCLSVCYSSSHGKLSLQTAIHYSKFTLWAEFAYELFNTDSCPSKRKYSSKGLTFVKSLHYFWVQKKDTNSLFLYRQTSDVLFQAQAHIPVKWLIWDISLVP